MFFFGSSIPSVDVKQAKEILDSNEGAIMLDVRTEGEYQQAHVPGSILVPLDQLSMKMRELEKYKSKDVMVLCRSGNRSASATAMLNNAGFEKAQNVSGGIGSWYRAGLPIQ